MEFHSNRPGCLKGLLVVVTTLPAVFASGTFAQSVPTYFPPPEVARPLARRLLENIKCESPTAFSHYWGDPERQPIVCALQLLGWPVADVVIASGKVDPNCPLPVITCMDALRALDGRINLVDWSAQGRESLKKTFKSPPDFPSLRELAAEVSEDVLLDIVVKASRTATAQAHWVATWYWSHIGKLSDRERIEPREIIKAGFSTSALNVAGNAVPAAVPAILKLAVNPPKYEQSAQRGRDHESSHIRRNVTSTLTRTYHKTLSGIIHIALSEDSVEFAADYVEMAFEVQPSLSTQKLEGLLADKSVERRHDIAYWLGRTGNRKYRKLLRPLLNDEDPQVRLGAALGLAHMGDGAGIALFKDGFARLSYLSTERERAVRALGALGSQEACEALWRAFTLSVKTQADETPWDIVGAMYDSCNVPWFVAKLFALRTASGKLPKGAVGAIRAIAYSECVAILGKYLHDKDSDVAHLAAEMIVRINEIDLKAGEDILNVTRQWWKTHKTE
ncbi:MAG: HEAT repeat domain-containing protein [Phycisphaerales bacterium]|nr:MAG: HEAT repeat domain-containing protein [Phycisphaerales bacterium]